VGDIPGLAEALFATALLILSGLVNILFGIAGISNSNLFEHGAYYLFGSLRSWGWTSVIVGVLELLAAVSLIRARRFGRYFGILIGAVAAVAALLGIPSYPLLSLAIFLVSLWIIHGLATKWVSDDL
jgi:hypothetical protein